MKFVILRILPKIDIKYTLNPLNLGPIFHYTTSFNIKSNNFLKFATGQTETNFEEQRE